LRAEQRTFFGARFGADFSGVRIHMGGAAAQAARTIGARAFTVGANIVLGAAAPHDLADPGSLPLLAHELAHVVQQTSAHQAGPRRGAKAAERVSAPDDIWERDARRMSLEALDGRTGVVRPGATMTGAPAVMRDAGRGQQEPLKSYRIPGTPLTVIPLEPARGAEAIYIFGIRLPFRAVRLTNENQVTPLPAIPSHWAGFTDLRQWQQAPPGRPPATLPRFTITVRADRFAVDVTDRVPLALRPDVVPGTPLHRKTDEGNLQRHTLVDPSVAIGRRFYAAGTLALRDEYPLHYSSPTEISVTALSRNLSTITPRTTKDRLDFGTVGSVRASAFGIGAAKGDVQAFIDLTRVDAALATLGLDRPKARAIRDEIVRLVRDKVAEIGRQRSLGEVASIVASLATNGPFMASLEQAVRRHVAPGTSTAAIRKAVANVAKELLGPGFTIQGPIFFGLPIGYGYFRAETTRHLRAPFAGSGIGTPFPATLAAVGPTIIPAGVITEYTTPAGGVTLARDWESIALSATVAGKPVLDPGSIGGAGVATGRIGFRLKGFDVVFEGGWRGRAALGQGQQEKDPFRRDVLSIAEARQHARARFAEDIERKEAGIFAADLVPAEVLASGRPNAEFYGTFRLIRRF
jgi:hypothetical protein